MSIFLLVLLTASQLVSLDIFHTHQDKVSCEISDNHFCLPEFHPTDGNSDFFAVSIFLVPNITVESNLVFYQKEFFSVDKNCLYRKTTSNQNKAPPAA